VEGDWDLIVYFGTMLEHFEATAAGLNDSSFSEVVPGEVIVAVEKPFCLRSEHVIAQVRRRRQVSMPCKSGGSVRQSLT